MRPSAFAVLRLITKFAMSALPPESGHGVFVDALINGHYIFYICTISSFLVFLRECPVVFFVVPCRFFDQRKI